MEEVVGRVGNPTYALSGGLKRFCELSFSALKKESTCVIEKPNITDERITSALQEKYSISAHAVEFLPLGWDAWSYRITAQDSIYFLKIRKTIPNPAGILLPRFLKEQGVEQIMVPLLSAESNLWEKVDDFYLILYPFITGQRVMDVGMSDAHWVEFGSVLKQLHTTRLPLEISNHIKREKFVPPRLEWIKEIHAQLRAYEPDDPFQKELSEFWLENYSTISLILDRTETLVKLMDSVNVEFVSCHGDIHTGNLLITEDDELFIVDWEDTRMAPKERDLIFLPGDLGTKQEKLFFRGYGESKLDPLKDAYYRHHWCIEDMGFAEHIFTTEDVGEKTKRDAFFWFKHLFVKGGSIDMALDTIVEF